MCNYVTNDEFEEMMEQLKDELAAEITGNTEESEEPEIPLGAVGSGVCAPDADLSANVDLDLPEEESDDGEIDVSDVGTGVMG